MKALKLLLSYRLQAHLDQLHNKLDRLEAQSERLEYLIRVAASHPLGEPPR